jgi:hypothetical protein
MDKPISPKKNANFQYAVMVWRYKIVIPKKTYVVKDNTWAHMDSWKFNQLF